MGLEENGISGGGGSLLDTGGLAQKLEDEGTNLENANILNLALDNVAFQGGVPAPITDNVRGGVDITAVSIVFNFNFTRERFGRAAVQDTIAQDADKLSLLTDDNMTGVGKTLAICGGLEFDSAVDALNVGAPNDFAGLGKPSDINDFSSRPDSMYINAGKIPGGARDGVMAAFRGDAEPEFINAMVRQVGGDTSAFTTFSEIVSDQPLMQSITTDSAAIGMLSAHPNGATDMAQSQTAMTEIAASQTAMQKVTASQTAMQEVAASQTALDEVTASATARGEIIPSAAAMGEMAASATAMSDIAGDQTFMQEVAASQTAMDEIGNSATARAEVYASGTALSEIRPVDQAIAKLSAGEGGADAANFPDMATLAGDATAMQEVAASQTAMQEVAASQTALDEVTASATARGEIIPSATAMGEMAASATAMSDIAGDQTFMQEVAASQTAMQEVAASQTAMQEVAASQTAVQEVVASQAAIREVAASQTAIQEVVASQAAIQEVVASQTAIQEVAASQTAMQEVAASQTAMQKVTASQTAMQEVANSQTALQEVAASQTAIDEIELASSQENFSGVVGSNQTKSVNNPDAALYIATMTGGGGMGVDNSAETIGQDGGDTTFGNSVASGGQAGQFEQDGSDGGFNTSSPDNLINGITGGGGAGSPPDQQTGKGGDGGLVKVLIANPNLNNLSLVVGRGGDDAPNGSFGDKKGEPGTAEILTPTVL